jgi:Flp pilus assembly protein TadG
MIKSEKGQSMVEMALLLPILLLLVSGIFDMGRLMYTYMNLQLATQETVRQGGLGADDSEMTSFAKDYVHVQDPSQLVVTITPDDTARDSGEYVTVKLQYPMEFITPIISNFIPSPIVVTTDSTIRVE